MLGIDLDVVAPDLAHAAHPVVGEDAAQCLLCGVHETRPAVAARDHEIWDPVTGVAADMSVAQVETQQVCVRGLVQRAAIAAWAFGVV